MQAVEGQESPWQRLSGSEDLGAGDQRSGRPLMPPYTAAQTGNTSLWQASLQRRSSSLYHNKTHVCVYPNCGKAYFFSHDLRRHEKMKHGRIGRSSLGAGSEANRQDHDEGGQFQGEGF